MTQEEELDKLASIYAQNENDYYTNDYSGYYNGWRACEALSGWGRGPAAPHRRGGPRSSLPDAS